jgi:hypothetical protein
MKSGAISPVSVAFAAVIAADWAVSLVPPANVTM